VKHIIIVMRPKESITEREIEVLLLLAINENQTAEMIKSKLKKNFDRSTVWRRLESLKNKGLIGSVLGSHETHNPRGGCDEIKKYFIFDYKYDEIYTELKKRGSIFTPLVGGKYVVTCHRHPDTFKYYPGEMLNDYQMRTGFMGVGEALALKDSFTEVRQATDEEIALHIILYGCSQCVKDVEMAARKLTAVIQKW